MVGSSEGGQDEHPTKARYQHRTAAWALMERRISTVTRHLDHWRYRRELLCLDDLDWLVLGHGVDAVDDDRLDVIARSGFLNHAVNRHRQR